jgi:eukaryotic-like serine/threonine-protein kinase
VEFRGTQRFVVTRVLGRGGMGVVYEALDLERDVRVALKTMRGWSPEALLRLKHEFRSLCDVRHPNLVALGELGEEQGTWFFTMELVTGQELLRWLHAPSAPAPARSRDEPTQPAEESPRERGGGEPRADEGRLRAAMAQLASGLKALHDAGKVHRDVKPSNVLVTPDGRVVILDFGLVADAAPVSIGSQQPFAGVAGTPSYMAPEVMKGGDLGPAADWYAVGVVLYRALTGQLPFGLRGPAALLEKQTSEPLPPSALFADVPADLDALCVELLRIDPVARPSGDEVLRRLGVRDAPSPRQTTPFVGRSEELALLAGALDRAVAGAAVTVVVEGESGIGKTSLVRRFAADVAARPGVLVLAGRCYERESVPFKAIDGIIDRLTAWLRTMPEAAAAEVVPARTALLCRTFPVLRRVPALARVASGHVPASGYDVRKLVFDELRALIARVARLRFLVLVVDDLQWAGEDSLALLSALLAPPRPPPLLLVCTTRGAARAHELPGVVHRVRLPPLDPASTMELVRSVLGRGHEAARAIAGESGGHPLFAAELARHAGAAGTVSRAVSLEEVIRRRVAALADVPRRVLELCAVAHEPLELDTMARALGGWSAAIQDGMTTLRAAQLARTTGARGGDRVEPYHDRVRLALLGEMSPARQRALHALLAASLEAAGRLDHEALALHWHGAGQRDKAARAACRAAEAASELLAFERAARLFRWALELGVDDAVVRIRCAEELANAGRGAEAAGMFLAAAAGASGPQAIDLRRRAMQQYLAGGRLDEGLALLAGLLDELGVPNPDGASAAFFALLARRAKLRLTSRWPAIPEARASSAEEHARIDVVWDAALGLGLIDVVRGSFFQTVNLELSLRSGDRRRCARAAMADALYLASQGGGPRLDEVLAIGDALASNLDNAAARGWALLARGMAESMLGRWVPALELLDRCAAILMEHPRRISAEEVLPSYAIASARFMANPSLHYLGRFAEARQRGLPLLQDAIERADIVSATHHQTGLQTSLWLAAGEVDEAVLHADAALAPWRGHRGQIPHFLDVQARVAIDLYRGDAKSAHVRAQGGWRELRRTLLLRVHYVRVSMLDLRGRAALALAALSPAERPRLLAEVGSAAARLAAEPTAWARALGRLLAAGASVIAGRPAGLAEAAALLTTEGMETHAACAQLLGGDATAYEEWCAREEVAQPGRLAVLYAPALLMDTR